MLRRIIVFLATILLLLNSALVNAATIGAWTVSNPMAVGASILYDGSKGAVISSVLITPNASQVAKVLRGGVAGYALQLAVEQLLGAVDWVLDPANNRIVYKVKTKDMSCSLSSFFCEYSYNPGFFQPIQRTAYQACQIKIEFYNSKQFEYKYECVGLRVGQYYNFNGIQVPSALCDIKVADPTSRVFTDLLVPVSPNNPEFEEKNLPLETVAQKVIENAESDNLDAQFAVLAAANNILSEAENDDAKAEPIERKLEENADDKCRIHNAYMNGQARIIEDRYNEMFVDSYDLYNKYYAIKNPLQGVGSWEVHVYRYAQVEQPILRQRILEANLAGCATTEYARKWANKAPPPRPGVHSK